MQDNTAFLAQIAETDKFRQKQLPVVMGIINVSDESFYSASRCCDISSFARRFNKMAEEGAGIIDIGACSTRPGSTSITLEHEWQLLEAPLKYLAALKSQVHQPSLPLSQYVPQNLPQSLPAISIDTFRSEIVRRAYDIIGDFIVNDISAGDDDVCMLSTVGELGLEYIAMHKRGVPSTMQQFCSYQSGVVREVAEYFLNFEERAAACGITDYIVDPGFGFAKNIEQNYELFMGMPQLMAIISGCDHVSTDCVSLVKKRHLLVGISRKSMIYKPLNIDPENSLSATTALNLQALMLGADVLRVHDVKEACECVKLFELLHSRS